MDVSATGQAASAVGTGTVTGSTASPAPPTTPTQNGAATPAVAAASTDTSSSQQTQSNSRTGLAPAIAKLFGGASPPEPIRLDVSYRVLQNPNEIVTVFSDPKTGQEVAQFPADILIGLASFFDQQRGVTLDRDA
jgi:hypothetical protein